MNKFFITFGMIVGSTVGALLPGLWGDSNILGGTSILLGLVGGIIGIWVGVKAAKFLG